ncbi:hypothetical protein Mal48_07910 [Thalassoglobus polymorphus]|uniref:Uncharacterized protein n=1 Tax=Thalassoglobus polymorphus TaxID=2527994 RepID=A0A517QJ36_9PLAN|nr:hypothetical protein Mal48_07910 [Thalassoglobus polymorphus]
MNPARRLRVAVGQRINESKDALVFDFRTFDGGSIVVEATDVQV